MKKIAVIVVVFVLLAAPIVTLAQQQPLQDPSQSSQQQAAPATGAEQNQQQPPDGSGLAPTGFERICSRDPLTGGLARCVQQIYVLSLGLGAIVAVFMIILAGYRYMTAQGNAQQVEGAKEAFASAFIGLIIIFVAFILLNVINPDLTQFKDFTNILPLPQLPATNP